MQQEPIIAQKQANRRQDAKRGSAHSVRLSAQEQAIWERVREADETVAGTLRRLLRERA